MATNPQLVLRNGRFDVSSSDYVHFKRQNITRWGVISQLMQCIERYLTQYAVNIIYVDVQRLVQLAELELDRYTPDELTSCITNKVQV